MFNSGTIGTLINKIRGAITGNASGGLTSSHPAGGAGVSNAGTITTLANNGAIRGGTAATDGGAGVSNSGTITRLSNTGTINGGPGPFVNEAGGAGVSNSGTITKLTNSGAISGGAGVANFDTGTITSLINLSGGTIKGGGGSQGRPGKSGAGVLNAGTITKLINSGVILGGAGGRSGGAGVWNSGTITTLADSGTISGGTGGTGGAGGAGVSNAGTLTTLTNGGTIRGGKGGSGVSGGAGGAGLWNSGTIATLSNSGTIRGGAGGSGASTGARGDAIYSAGWIGTIANSGSIIGNVVIDNQTNVTITGGSGSTFGGWTGGTITVGNGALTFGGGKTFLGDDVTVNGGKGTVTNEDALRIASPQTVAGNFTQAATGALDLDFAGKAWGEYGALTISSLATLDGRLAIDLTGGFTLAVHDKFDILSFASLAGPGFDALSLDGSLCNATSTDFWNCGGVRLREAISSTSLDLVVAQASLVPASACQARP